MRLPKTLYVTTKTIGKDSFLVANSSMFDVIEDDGDPETVGVYQLVERKKARKVLEVKDV